MASSIVIFLYFGEYSSRHTVQGMIVPNMGLITIYTKNRGVVVKKFVQQGDVVTKGQLICLISTEQETISGLGFSAQEMALLKKQIEIQKKEMVVFEKNVNLYNKLLKQHIISELEYQNRQSQYFSAKLALYNYEKELTQAKEKADYAIRSPLDGVIAVLIATTGDHVTDEAPIASIIPKSSKLEGQLFVPTSKAGFVKPGQKVLIKYQAYPYQRFGLYDSIVTRVDKSIINPQELRGTFIPVKIDEAFYRVTVTLQQQTVSVYGKPYPLTVGMLFDGVILGEKRRIWQWVMDPLYSFKGSL
jgi:membrane fusion protein